MGCYGGNLKANKMQVNFGILASSAAHAAICSIDVTKSVNQRLVLELGIKFLNIGLGSRGCAGHGMDQ